MPKTNFYTKQAISPVIATILLIAITVTISVTTFQYLQTYSEETLETTSSNQILDGLRTRVIDANSDTGYIQTPYDNLNISRVVLDGVECLGNEGIATSRTLQINLTSCSNNVTSSRPTLTIETDEGIIQQDLSRRDLGVTNSVASGTSGFDCSSINGSWIEVPGSSYFGTSNFCVMQYEAKAYNTGTDLVENRSSNTISEFIPYSAPQATPWVDIDFTNSRLACDSLNSEYSNLDGTFRMITNREWMTIARNAEQQSTNWDSGTVGSGSMFRGHSDNDPSNALAVSNTSDYYDGTENSASSVQRRVLELSNGVEIWDLAGNVWQWVDMLEDGSNINNAYACPGETEFSQCSSMGDDFSKNNSQALGFPIEREMGPLGNYDSTNGVGQIFSSSNPSRALLRGGYWDNDANAGAFAAGLNGAPSVATAYRGFRCSYEP